MHKCKYSHNSDDIRTASSRKRKTQFSEKYGAKKQKIVISEQTPKIVTGVNVEHFVQSRAVEVQALAEVVKDIGGNHAAFQRLPRHMRRRAMSHNLKRIPHRLRDVVKVEIEKTKAPSKRPSRRYRRRPSNLLSEYERRKRKIAWLETHIWHAKRFKMVEKWGYRLAFHPNDKSIRACYRAVSRHCLMQDVSYESYIEIKGPRQDILTGLSHLTNGNTGLTFASKMLASGTHQGSLVLYSFNSYPNSCIGHVTFLWRPVIESSICDDHTDTSTLWISCHPSFFSTTLKEIKSCFLATSCKPAVEVNSMQDQLVTFRLFGPASNAILSEVLQPADISTEDGKDKSGSLSRVNEEQLSTGISNTEQTETNEESTSSKLTGREAISEDVSASWRDKQVWWKDYYNLVQARTTHMQQAYLLATIGQCHSPAIFPPNRVLALTVRDPRFLIPPKRNKVPTLNTGSGCSDLSSELFTPDVSQSPLWDHEVRIKVKATKMSEQKMNEIRSKQLIPGSPLILGDRESRIPVILIQRPGISSSGRSSQDSLPDGYTSGWDIIIPAGWAMAFWIALVYRGARVGGVREARSIALQSGQILRPYNFPDSAAGEEEAKAEYEERQLRHDKRPPAKRPNYVKLGFPNPFSFQFEVLVQQWNKQVITHWEDVFKDVPLELRGNVEMVVKGGGEFNVLREKKLLRVLCSLCSDIKAVCSNKNKMQNVKAISSNCPGKHFNTNLKTTVYKYLNSSENGKRLLKNGLNCVVAVRLRAFQRGVPAASARICLPTREDLNKLDRDPNFGGPVEIMHKDTGAMQRKEERKETLRMRKRKKQGKGRKDDSVELAVSQAAKPEEKSFAVRISSKDNVNDTENEQSEISETRGKITKQMEQTLKPNLINHTSHAVIGCVQNGDFNLSQGQGYALGFCSLTALLHLLNDQRGLKHPLVLVRNTTSLQYRFASLSLVN